MKVIKRTGLVPVKFLHSSPPYTAGEIAGLPPEKVLKAWPMRIDGNPVIALVDIPDEYETIDGPDLPEIDEAPKAATGAAGEPEAPVEIPEKWEDLHGMAQIALAKKIAGKAKSDTVKADEAREIIKAEVDSRAKESADKAATGAAG